MIRVRVPASTSNLGPGFDVLGLALKCYLQVSASKADKNDDEPNLEVKGEGAAELSVGKDNLIWQVIEFAAERENISIPPVRIVIENQIPLSRGLGSSAAAIIAGLKLFEAITEHHLDEDKLLSYAMKFESHPDNLAPALMGGLVVNCVTSDHKVSSVKLSWPSQIKVVIVVPEFRLSTATAREILPSTVSRQDAIYNVQRTALFLSALTAGRFDFLREAMRDRLHQPMRQALIPGLEEILSLPQRDGFYGIALSGAGPSILALVDSGDNRFEDEIGGSIIDIFRNHGIKSSAMALEIDNEGCTVEGSL